MLETGRRTAISSSELGLYSDRGDRYNRNRYGSIVRKFTIGVMVVAAVILVVIFLYDFTSATSANSKINQETKHIYILQNALKKSSNFSKKPASSTTSPQINGTAFTYMQDRSDDEDRENSVRQVESKDEILAETRIEGDPEFRAQNLNNFKLRKRVLKSIENDMDSHGPEGKQLFENHAVVYRVRQRFKHPDYDEDASYEESRPTPFHWELKTPHPVSFKRPRYPQLSQYRYPHSSRNIQDIIKYLTNDAEVPNRGIKFTGVYVNPKKYDLSPEIGEMMSNSDRSEEDGSPSYPVVLNDDPFYQYKPKHPADVNLLATSNVRFSPTGLHRYNSFYDPLYTRPVINYNKQPSSIEAQYENPSSYTANNLMKKRKPKPFSVMLDIYPITDIMEQNKKNSRPRPQMSPEDYDFRRPIQFNRGPKFYAPPPQSIPAVALPNQHGLSDEDERQQMIFHLNLYPKRKNKLSRHDVIHRSESMAPEERRQFAEKIMSPLETIAKHLAVEESKLTENEKTDENDLSITRYHETVLETKNEDKSLPHRKNEFLDLSQDNSDGFVPSNHKASVDEDYASTEKYEIEAQKIIETTIENKHDDYTTTESTTVTNNDDIKSTTLSKNVDTIEGFQRFSDGLLATD